MNAPNIALIPTINGLPSPIPEGAMYLANVFNDNLEGALLYLAPYQLDLTLFDTFEFFQGLLTDPPAGVTDVISSSSSSAVSNRSTKKSSAPISRAFVVTVAPRPSTAAG